MTVRLLTRRVGAVAWTETTPGAQIRQRVAEALADPLVSDVILEDDAAASLRDRIVVLVCAKLGAEPRS